MMQEVFNYVVGAGVNLFDTADSYGKPSTPVVDHQPVPITSRAIPEQP